MPRRNATRNTTDAQISVPKARTQATETKRTRTNVIIDKPPGMDVNAVLRDITDQYLASPAPQKKTKRKPSRSTAATAPKPNRIESSLPPSSPPSTSSQMPADTSYNFPEINALPSDPIYTDRNAAEDPFGFFAVEAKLKASRRPRAPTVPRAFQVASSDSVDGNIMDESLQQAFATPKPRNPLRTPRKRTDARKRKLEPSTSSHSSSAGGEDREEESESMPSTPSPVKAGDRSVEVDAEEDLKDVAKEKRKGRGRKKVEPTRAEAGMNPMEIARNLEALLPRRPKPEAAVRRAGRGHGSKVPARFDDSDGGNKKQKGQKDNKKRVQPSVKGKGKRETEGSDGDEDEEEMRRRQARIDYFKKLDGYEVQKEDVYIV
jgi:hypothetical protein